MRLGAEHTGLMGGDEGQNKDYCFQVNWKTEGRNDWHF